MQQSLKRLLKKNLPHLLYFYRYLRYRLIIILAISILVGLLDGLGLAMFIPLLELVGDETEAAATAEQMGNLAFLLDSITALGFELTLNVVLTTMLIFFVLKGLAKWLEAYLTTIYRQFFIRTIREESIKALNRYDFQEFVIADAGMIQNTLSGEVNQVASAYSNYNLLLQQLIMVITYSALAFFSNPQFAVLVVAGGIMTNLLFMFIYKKTKELSNKLVKSNHGFQGLLIQNVAFFKYLSATGRLKSIESKLIQKVYEIEDSVRKTGFLHAILTGVREPLIVLIVVLTILLQIKYMGGSLSTIILSLLFFYRGLGAVMLLQSSYNNFLARSGSLTNMKNFVANLQEHRKKDGTREIESFREKIELRNVFFSYKNTTVLRNINLCLFKNETLALVGESGSGKTTMINLLSGLLRPDEGQMLIDGVNIREINMGSLQKRIGYITQEPVVFDDTIFNNVTFWTEKTEINISRFHRAMEQASILKFVNGLKDKEETRLGNNGISLSGGQKQRISIARELFKEIDLLFMDEATSALDSETERTIQKSIEALKGKYTILIIAHRLSTIKHADRVIVLNKGEINQIGTYEELIERSTFFKRIVELQEL